MNPNNLTQEQIKQGYSTIPGAYDPITGKLKTSQGFDTFTNTSTTNIISPDTLQSQQKIILPNTPIPTKPQPAPIDYDAMFGLTDFQKQAEQTQETGLSEIIKSMTALQGEQADLQAERQRQGLQDKYRENQATKARILALDAEMQQDDIQLAQKLRAEERRDTLLPFAQMGQAKLAGDAAIYRGLKTAEKNTLISQQLAQQGEIALAEQFAKDAIDAKYAPYKQNIENYKTILEVIKPSLTAAENKRLKAQESKVIKEENDIKKFEEDEKTSNSYLFTAIQGQAPKDLVAKAQDLINKGAKPNEVAKVLGKYSLSQADRLDLELKKAQINSANRANRPSTTVEAPTIKSINGKDMQWDGKQWVEPTTTGVGVGSQTTMVAERGLDKINQTKSLLENKKGLNASAGTLKGSGLLYLQNTRDWRAGVKNIMSKLTIDELGRIKTDGVTFGALSDPEREAVGAAASVLVSGSVKDKNGNPTGKFNISESMVEEALAEIKKYQDLDFLYRTGMTPEEYEAQKFLNATDQVLQNTNSAYSTYQ